MRAAHSFLAIALALTTPAVVPAADPADDAGCKAEEAAMERDIALARSKGQMLRRRQFADALAALQTRCKTQVPEQDRAAHIESLEQEIRELQLELDRAEQQLRELKHKGP